MNCWQSATADLIDDSPQLFQDTSIRIERILLEMVRPDPVQPRRVLPERIHFAFHNQELTPMQALRELVQIAQVAARQQGRPFNNVLELLSQGENEQERRLKSNYRLKSDCSENWSTWQSQCEMMDR